MATAVQERQIDWAAIGKELIHPTRAMVLDAFVKAGEPLSPSQIAEESGERLGNVSYHVRALLEKGFIRLTRTEPRRGAVAHFYVLTAKAIAS